MENLILSTITMSVSVWLISTLRPLIKNNLKTFKLPILLIILSLSNVVTVWADTHPIVQLDASVVGFVGQSQTGPLNQAVHITSYEEFSTIFGTSTNGLDNPYLAPSVSAYFQNGGQVAYIVRVPVATDDSFIGHDGGAGSRTGLQALLDEDTISIVAIPGVTSTTVQTAMILQCEQTGSCMAILDSTAINNISAVAIQRAALTSTDGYAALYYPWFNAQHEGKSMILPPSGFVAGIYAKTSPKDSPAGLDALINGVEGLTHEINTTESDILNTQSINAIRNLSGNYYVWGGRTIATELQWKYIAVRRIGMVIKESIFKGTEWCLNEPNDFPLWIQLKSDIENFMNDLWRAGWFQGSTPEDAYFVQIGESTMTQTDIDEGRTIMYVGFAGLRPAEFIILKIVQERSVLEQRYRFIPVVNMFLLD